MGTHDSQAPTTPGGWAADGYARAKGGRNRRQGLRMMSRASGWSPDATSWPPASVARLLNSAEFTRPDRSLHRPLGHCRNCQAASWPERRRSPPPSSHVRPPEAGQARTVHIDLLILLETKAVAAEAHEPVQDLASWPLNTVTATRGVICRQDARPH